MSNLDQRGEQHWADRESCGEYKEYGAGDFSPRHAIFKRAQRTLGSNRVCPPEKEKRRCIVPLVQLVLVLVVVGVLLWLINRYVPMQGSIKSILNAVVVIAVVLWLLQVFGLFTSLSRIRVGT
jgi:hypothetical protein